VNRSLLRSCGIGMLSGGLLGAALTASVSAPLTFPLILAAVGAFLL
jgi:hypothetical protein